MQAVIAAKASHAFPIHHAHDSRRVIGIGFDVEEGGVIDEVSVQPPVFLHRHQGRELHQ